MSDPQIRVLQGAVGATSARALALVTPGLPDPPPIEAAALDGSGSAVGRVDPLPVSPPVRAALVARGVRLYSLRFTGLRPATAYRLRFREEALRPDVRLRTTGGYGADRPLRVAVASCFFRQYRKGARFAAALRAPPLRGVDFKILMGDNVYLDVKPGMVWEPDDPYDVTVADYLGYLREDPYADGVGGSPSVTTWDDHEFWNDYPSDRQPHLRVLRGARYPEAWGPAVRDALEAFQVPLNPPMGTGWGRSYVLEEGLPVSFFVADLRSERELAGVPVRLLPDDALERLEAWAADLDRPGVLVTGQPLWLESGRFDHAPASFALQYRRLWRALLRAPADILLLSGDIHYSRLLRLSVPIRREGRLSERDVYDFVCSPASHIPGAAGSLFSYLLGRAAQGAQPRSDPKIPARIDVYWGAIVGQPGPAPRVAEHLFSTDAPNALGWLEFTPTARGDVQLRAAVFDIDATPPRPARSFVAARPPRFENGRLALEEDPDARCETSVPVRLRARRPP